MNAPGSAFLDQVADLHRADFSPQDADAGTAPAASAIALAEPCAVQRRAVSRATSGDATVQVTSYSVFFGREIDLRTDDAILWAGRTLRVDGLLDGFEVTAEGRS